MKVITYLSFTLLSVFIQFCFMDYIQEKIQINDKPALNVTSHNKVDNILKNISSNPHALYYRTHRSRSFKSSSTTVTNRSEKTNKSIPTLFPATTDISTTIFDILYDENTTEATTTESIFATEIDNITEVTLFEIKNNSSSTPKPILKERPNKFCGCNLLYEVCDINCCCDPDCTHQNIILFQCDKIEKTKGLYNGCIPHLMDGELRFGQRTFDTLFCVVKTNLPEAIIVKQADSAMMRNYSKWLSIPQEKTSYEFKKSLYKKGDPVWLLKNGAIYYLDFATPMVNNYCTDRAPIIFLKEERIKCLTNMHDLEMFHIANTESSMIISALEKTVNISTLNCSNVHCVNWNILRCDDGICKNYNKTSDGALCADGACINIALKIEYYFYYYEFKIVNATIKLHIQNLSNIYPFMWQEIAVNFIMTNSSQQKVVEFSGNPGYISYLPIIISSASINYTDNFFNITSGNHMILPENQNGRCTRSKTSFNVVRFGVNKRIKCRYVHSNISLAHKNTSICKSIQENIKVMLGISSNLSVSPFGNPSGIKDEDWLKLQNPFMEQVYGEYSETASKLRCYNLINRISLLFVFANVNGIGFDGQNKILLGKFEAAVYNAYFDAPDISTVLTMDINFVDVSKPNLYVYASSPHLNIHLPKDFFFPFPQNNCNHMPHSCVVNIFCYTIIFLTNKIPL